LPLLAVDNGRPTVRANFKNGLLIRRIFTSAFGALKVKVDVTFVIVIDR
jgi:hypothetical protein